MSGDLSEVYAPEATELPRSVLLSEIVANTLALLHGSVLLLDLCGALAVARGAFRRRVLRWWQWAYLVLAGGKAASYLVLRGCPLTLLEQQLRSSGGSASAFRGSFVEHYLPWIPGDVDTALTLVLLSCGLIAVVQAASRSMTTLEDPFPHNEAT